jgi:periplasmic protein TonB
VPAMFALNPEDLADLRRWALSGAVVVCVYGGIAAAMVRWHDPVVDTSEPTGAIVVEFAPEVVAPTAPETKVAPGPEQVQSDAVPEKPIEKVEKEPEEKIEEDKGELTVEQKAEQKPPEEMPRDASPISTPPPELPKIAALPAGPIQGTPKKAVDPKAMQTWVGEIAAAIERKKRHVRFRQEAVAEVTFTLDKQGHLIDSRITKSSGAADLDAEALTLLNRAQPFPPGRGITDEQVHLTVPIRFSLK